MEPKMVRSAWWRVACLMLFVGSLAMSMGCIRTTQEPPRSSSLLAAARADGIDLDDPFYVSEATLAEARHELRSYMRPEDLLRALRDYLYWNNDKPFTYAPHLTLNAERAFKERRGDCMTYSMLFVSLARGMGLAVYLVHVRDFEAYYEQGGELFVSSHVAIGYGVGPSAKVFDFKKEITDWKLSVYSAIDDDDARALYFNNIAVDWMGARRYDDAEKLFRVLTEHAPGVPEPLNNYGVLLLRTHRYKDALTLLRKGIERFPAHKTLYTNAIVAADAAGDHAVVEELDKKMWDLTHSDPAYVFGRGMRFLSHRAYDAAIKELSRARDAMPESAVVLAGLGRAYVGSGDLVRGKEILEEAKKKAALPLQRQLEDKLAKLRELQEKAPHAERSN